MPLRVRLRADLDVARRAHDSERIALIRTLIAAIDNAEAVDEQASGAADSPVEVPRRRLSDHEIKRIVLRESAELRTAAEDYELHGQTDEATRLRSLSFLADQYSEEMP